jgi:hypothetical protein
MNTVTKIGFAIGIASAASFYPAGANAWWNDDDYHDRWYGGPWYGGYPGYGWGGYPGYGWGGYPGYWGHPGYGWGGYPGYNQPRTIILNPQISVTPREQKPETKPPQ